MAYTKTTNFQGEGNRLIVFAQPILAVAIDQRPAQFLFEPLDRARECRLGQAPRNAATVVGC